MRQIGPGVHELCSHIQINKQTDMQTLITALSLLVIMYTLHMLGLLSKEYTRVKAGTVLPGSN